MRVKTFFRMLRIIAAITLFFFCWTFLPIYSAVAFAAEKKQETVASSQKSGEPQKAATSGEKFEKALEAIRESVSRAEAKEAIKQDFTAEVAEVKKQRVEIESADVELNKEFAATEKKLTDAKLPKEILDRHVKFVKHYEDNLKELKINLDGHEKAQKTQDKEKAKEYLRKAKLHLEKTKAPSKHIPLDPNNLPNRMVKGKERAPRLKKEEFERDFGPKKVPSKLTHSSSLIASNHEPRATNHELNLMISAGNQREWTRIALKSTSLLTPQSLPILLAYNGDLNDLGISLPRPSGENVGSAPEWFNRGVRGGFDPATQNPEGWPVPFETTPLSGGEGPIPSLATLSATSYEPSTMLLAQATTDPPSSADLAETPEVQFTSEIRAKAQELGSNPVKIYEYVKNNFFFEPYYGSLKGASETFAEKAGNDFDQASLLIALLRSANIPAKYEYGTVEIPIERVKKWLGVESETVAGDILASNGIPVGFIVEGGKISKARLEHVWVEAWVSYDNYRGQPGSQNKTWISLDPSFKQVRYTRGPDIKAIMNFDPTAFMNELKSNSTYSDSGYYVTNVNETFIQQKLTEYQTTFSNYIATNMPNAKPQDLVGKFDILYEKFGILPATLPYKTIVKGASYSEIPDVLRHKLQINNNSPKVFGIFGTVDINYQTNLSHLAGKKITISYQPATAADDSTLRNYGALSAVPAYLVNMKPVLMIDGMTAATGGEIGLGDTQQINLTFSSPNIPTDIVSHTMTAGGYHAIGINLQRIPKALLQKQTDRMQAMKSYIESILSGTPSAPPSGDSRDNLVGDMLYDVAVNYYYNLDAMNDLMSRVTDIIWVRQPSEAMVLMNLKVNTMFGIPLSAQPVGMSIDVNRNIVSVFSIVGNKTIEKLFSLWSSQGTSAMEHTVFEELFGIDSVSTEKVLQIANQNNIPIYLVAQTNINQVLPILSVSDSVKNEIQNAIAAGKIVIIPQTEIQYNYWRGTGYIIQDPITLAAAYRISDGINGGSTSIEANCSPDPSNPWTNLFPAVCRLLAYSGFLLVEGGTSQTEALQLIQGMWDSVSSLIVKMDPNAPSEDIVKAVNVFNAFSKSIVDYMIVMYVGVPAIDLMQNIPLSIGGGIDFLITTILYPVSFEFARDVCNRYVGFLILNYLYEYTILFYGGLINAFEEF